MEETVAVLTDAFEHLTLDATLRWCAEHGVTGVEFGVGGYSPSPHVDRAALLADAGACRALTARLDDAGLALVALNASGNPLHPDPAVAAEHEQALRDAIMLASELGVERVVAMSGCPGGPAGRAGGAGSWPVFAGGAWLPDMEGLWDAQWSERIAPFWARLSGWAQQTAPDVVICLELHPGTSIYNAASFLALREVTGDNVAVNLDPSHFWWQGIDPLATLAWIGEHVAFVHGKDTVLHRDRVALHGVLDYRWPATAQTMPWHFCAVGRGRPLAEWAALLGALADAGYDGPISIEHEDPTLSPEDGVEASRAGLLAAAQLVPTLTSEEEQWAR